jgi:TPR repeat protein
MAVTARNVLRRPPRSVAMILRRLPLIAAAALAVALPARATLDDGLDALRHNDYARAVKELRPLADKGNAEAQYRVGLMYEFGKGYPRDMAKGIAWLARAGNQGHTGAQQELGVIYNEGDGVARDDAKAVAWFRKAAERGNPTAQYNLGLMIAKGTGAPQSDAGAIAWWRKSAAQGLAIAQFKLGVAYENGQGVAKDPALAYANYAIAARNGSDDGAAYRDDIGKTLSPAQRRGAEAIANAWQTGDAMPTSLAAASPKGSGATSGWGGAAAAPTAAAAAHKDSCTAKGALEGDAFTATHCAVALYGDQHSVAIWFNEQPIGADEAEGFALSSYAKADPGGKQRTLVQVMFCPGGGKDVANAAAVKAIDLNTNHAKSPLDGVQWSLVPTDFKVEKLAGKLEPGGVLAGRISGHKGKTTFVLDFDLALPQKDAAAGMGCS